MAQQVPLPRQEDRRPVPGHLPGDLRLLQHLLLDVLPHTGGQHGRQVKGDPDYRGWIIKPEVILEHRGQWLSYRSRLYPSEREVMYP